MKDNQYAKDFELFKKAIREGRRYKVDPRTGNVKVPELKHLEREDNWVRSTITNEVMPKGDQKILQCVCKFMLRHSDRANLESMKSHVNHFYKIARLLGPWYKNSTGADRCKKVYVLLAKKKRLEKNRLARIRGEKEKLVITRFPHGILSSIIQLGEVAPECSTRLQEIQLFLSQLICGNRAVSAK